MYLFVYSWLCLVLTPVYRLPLVAASESYSLVALCRLLTVVASRCRGETPGCTDFSSCDARARKLLLSGSRAWVSSCSAQA